MLSFKAKFVLRETFDLIQDHFDESITPQTKEDILILLNLNDNLSQSELELLNYTMDNYSDPEKCHTYCKQKIAEWTDTPVKSKSVEHKEQFKNDMSKKEKVAVKDIKVDIICYHEKAVPLFEELAPLVKAHIMRLGSYGFTSATNSEKSLRILEPISIHDEYGDWQFDVLFSLAEIILISTNNYFPLSWRLSADANIDINIKMGTRENQAQVGIKEDLQGWLKTVLTRERKSDKYQKWLDLLDKQDVDCLEDLYKWKESDWEIFGRNNIMARGILKDNIEKQKQSTKFTLQQKSLSPSELYSNLHKIKRYFLFHEGNVDTVSYLNQAAIEETFEEMSKFYEGEEILANLKQYFETFSLPKTLNVITNRGLLLFGPPGTGKTALTDTLPKKIGLTAVVFPLASAEVNRSLVGQTEKLLLDLCNRARYMPHLLCCIAVDEIDSLAPKRDEKSSQSKNDALSVLLALVGGIKDVPNLVFLASTNRKNMMDEAFLRRLSGQFFIGRPSPSARRKILSRMYQNGVIISPKNFDDLVVLTTNFSGAALVQLVSYIVIETELRFKNKELPLSKLLELAMMTSEQFNIKLGAYSLPKLFMSNPQLLNNIGNNNIPTKNYTGNVIVDLQRKVIIKQTAGEGPDEFSPGSCSMATVLPIIAGTFVQMQVDFIQVLDLDLLLVNSAFDDSKTMEILTEKVNESKQYAKSCLILDLDTLVGVNNTESNSNMGKNTSFSLFNHKLFQFVLSTTTSAMYTKDRQLWIVLVSQNPYLTRSLKKSLSWKIDEEEKKEMEEEERRQNKILYCVYCKFPYVEADNKHDACNYHDGFVYDEDFIPVHKSQLDKRPSNEGLKYICCKRGYNEAGCQKGAHTTVLRAQKNKEYIEKLNVMRQNSMPL